MACKNPTFDNWEKVCPDCGENCPSFDAMLKLAPILFALDTQL
jgi:hypothetical protein